MDVGVDVFVFELRRTAGQMRAEMEKRLPAYYTIAPIKVS